MEKIFHDGEWLTPQEMRDKVLDYYNGIFQKKGDRHYQMQHLFPNTLDRESVILDYGCGMGGISNLFTEKYGCRVDAVDISANELEKGKLVFGSNPNINFMLLEEFMFPVEKYDMIFSSQVIEHVHNPGIYLSNINSMLKNEGYFLVGLPNIVNFNYLINLMFFSQERARKHSLRVLNNYNKASEHINGWDPLHFIQLCASVGFELIRWLPTEGTPMSSILNKIPLIGKYLYKIPFQTRLSYTMFFLFKKRHTVKISPND